MIKIKLKQKYVSEASGIRHDGRPAERLRDQQMNKGLPEEILGAGDTIPNSQIRRRHDGRPAERFRDQQMNSDTMETVPFQRGKMGDPTAKRGTRGEPTIPAQAASPEPPKRGNLGGETLQPGGSREENMRTVQHVPSFARDPEHHYNRMKQIDIDSRADNFRKG